MVSTWLRPFSSEVEQVAAPPARNGPRARETPSRAAHATRNRIVGSMAESRSVPVLTDLTLRDEQRLGRRLERARRTGDERAFDALATELARAAERVERRRAAVPAVSYPPELPVSAHREELLAAIRDHQVVVVAGETGSGKTTQLPKLCLELGRGIEGMIAHTQPRRLAARTVAERIAGELATELGGAVGYAVRFTDRSRPETRVRLVTDGLLVARSSATGCCGATTR